MKLMVNYTISGQKSYAIMTPADLTVLELLAQRDDRLKITEVKKYKRRSVRV